MDEMSNVNDARKEATQTLKSVKKAHRTGGTTKHNQP
jgi:hypothetical protein